MFGPSGLPVVVAQLDERHANTKRNSLCIRVVIWPLQWNQFKCL